MRLMNQLAHVTLLLLLARLDVLGVYKLVSALARL